MYYVYCVYYVYLRKIDYYVNNNIAKEKKEYRSSC